jgi:hypothetical protein
VLLSLVLSVSCVYGVVHLSGSPTPRRRATCPYHLRIRHKAHVIDKHRISHVHKVKQDAVVWKLAAMFSAWGRDRDAGVFWLDNVLTWPASRTSLDSRGFPAGSRPLYVLPKRRECVEEALGAA